MLFFFLGKRVDVIKNTLQTVRLCAGPELGQIFRTIRLGHEPGQTIVEVTTVVPRQP